jgi:hypothetical protein
MLQLRGDPDFMQELLVARVLVLLGYLERDPPLLNRIVGAVYVSEGPGRDSSQNAVFSDFLSGSEQVWLRFRWRRMAVQFCLAIIGPSTDSVKGNIFVTQA